MFVTVAVVVAVVLVLLAVALGVAIHSKPDAFRVERSADVAAPPAVVFDTINALGRWAEWSPYVDRDPKMRTTLTGPAAGPGSAYAWEGNGQVGKGQLAIVEAVPAERVTMRLRFDRPFKCDNVVNFLVAPSAGGSRVTWAMDGKNTTFSKAMSLVIDMDQMCGKDFEKGLANLDALMRRKPGRAVVVNSQEAMSAGPAR